MFVIGMFSNYPLFQIIFRVALTLVVLFRKEIVATEDMLELSNVFKSMVASDIVIDCHRFLKLVFDTTSKSVRRADIERLRVTPLPIDL